MAAASVVDEILRNNPLIKRDVVAHGRTWFVLRNGVVNIYGPLTAADAQRIGKVDRVSQIQFASQFEVPAATLQQLDRHVLAAHPNAALRETLNGAGAFDDLEFLSRLPKLRSLLVDGNRALDLAPIPAHVALASLGVGGLGTSLAPLHGYRSLENLAVRENVTDLETIGTLANLERLSIDDGCPARLDFLAGLARLQTLSLAGKPGARSLAPLASLPRLKTLTIDMPVTAALLAPLAAAPALEVVRIRRGDLAKARALPFRVEAI